MNDVSNKDYVTINANGIFVGGKPTKMYRDVPIASGSVYAMLPEPVVKRFKEWQTKYPEIEELHILTSETEGTYKKTGNPSGKHGIYTWYRVKIKNKTEPNNWVRGMYYINSDVCAVSCIDDVLDFKFPNVNKEKTKECSDMLALLLDPVDQKITKKQVVDNTKKFDVGSDKVVQKKGFLGRVFKNNQNE